MARVFSVVGLGFGDEGKGASIDHLVRQHAAHTVVRFNGGGNAAHNVVLEDGTHHTFSQFGSGTLAGARTHLSRYMLVNPSALINEERALQAIGITDAFDRLTIDGDAFVTTYWHMVANRERERQRGTQAHGTCGMGIGETVQSALDNPSAAIRVRDLLEPKLLGAKLELGKQMCLAEFPECGSRIAPPIDVWIELANRIRIVDGDETRQILKQSGTVIFEGAQGVLLDQDFGFAPHTTWSKTTFENADALIKEAGRAVSGVTRVGVMRTYMTRHGAGPFVTESTLKWPEPHNDARGYQGAFRQGELDFPALRYALRSVAGVDELAVTHMDRVPEHVCLAYTSEFKPDAAYLSTCRPVYTPLRFFCDSELLDIIESELGTRVSIISSGPTPSDKQARNQ